MKMAKLSGLKFSLALMVLCCVQPAVVRGDPPIDRAGLTDNIVVLLGTTVTSTDTTPAITLGNGTIDNSGTIENTTETERAILIGNSAVITNLSQITGKIEIQSSDGAPSSVTNQQGTINGSIEFNTVGSANGTVTNSGLLTGTDGEAIRFNGRTSDLVTLELGSQTSGAIRMGGFSGDDDDRVEIAAGANLDNGTATEAIEMEGGTVNNNGNISSSQIGIRFTDNNNNAQSVGDRRVVNIGSINANSVAILDSSSQDGVDSTILNDGVVSSQDSNATIFVARLGNSNSTAANINIENGLTPNSNNANATISGASGVLVTGNVHTEINNRGQILTSTGYGIRIGSQDTTGALSHFVSNTGNINSNGNSTGGVLIDHNTGDDDDDEAVFAQVRNSGSISGASGVTFVGDINSNVTNGEGSVIAGTRALNSNTNSNDSGGAAVDIQHVSNSNAATAHEIENNGLLESASGQAVRAIVNTVGTSSFTLRNNVAILPNEIGPQSFSGGTISGQGGVLVLGNMSADIRNSGLIEGTSSGTSFGGNLQYGGIGIGVSVIKDSGVGGTSFLENTGSILGGVAGAIFFSPSTAVGGLVTVNNGVLAAPSALPQDLNEALIEGNEVGLAFLGSNSETENRGTIRGADQAGIAYGNGGTGPGATHQLVNSGLVESYNGSGILALAEDDADNRVVVNNTGEIRGFESGIYAVQGVGVSITNSGIISSTGDDDDDDDDDGAIRFETSRLAAVENSVVNNADGIIAGGVNYGVKAEISTGNRSSLSILNAGTIEGEAGGIFARVWNTAVDIDNSGIVQSNASTAIRLQQGDDDDDDAPITINNSGSILATGDSAAIQSNLRNDVDITSTGIISSPNFYSVVTEDGNDTVTLGEGSDTTGGLALGGGNNSVTLSGNGILRGNIDSTREISKTGSGYFTWQGAANFEGTIDLDVEGGTLEIAPGDRLIEPGSLTPQVLANVNEILNVDTVVSNGATLLVQDGMRLSVNNLDVDGPGSQLIIGSGGEGALVDDGDGAQETTATFTNGASFTVNQNSELFVRDLQMENSTGLVAGSAVVTDSLFMENSNIHVTSTGSFEALDDTTLINSSLTVDEGGFISSADAIQYNNSSVVINGTQGGSIILGGGSRLGGSGTIRGNATLQSGATLAPGNSPGTLNIGGDLTLLPGTTTEIELAPNANDRVNVGGTATLGGTLKVIEFASLASVPSNTVFTIIDAPNAPIQGAFSDIQLLVSPVVKIQALQNTNTFQLLLTRTDYVNFQQSENEKNLALNLQMIQAAGGAGLLQLTGAIDSQTTAAAVANALDQIHAEPFDVLPNIAFQHQQQYASQMEQYLYTARLNLQRQNAVATGAPATAQTKISAATPAVANGSVVPDYGTHNSLFTDPKSRYGGFGYAYSVESDQDTIRNGLGATLRSGSETSDRGIQAGVDKRINDELVLGVSFGTGDVKTDLRDGRGRFDGDQYQLGVYGTWAREGGYIDALLTYNNYDFDSLRAVTFPGFANVLRASQDVSAISGYIGGGWMSQDTGSWNWGPTASLQWTNADLDGFNETGGVAALNVSGRTVDSIRSQVGVRATRKYDFGKDRQVIPELRARWSHEFANDDRNIIAGFAAAPGFVPFTSVAASPDRDTFFLGGSVNGYFARNFSGFINYDAEVGRQGGTLHAGRGGLTFKF